MRSRLIASYREFFSKEARVASFVEGTVLIIAAFAADYLASVYSVAYLSRPTSVYVGDLFLDNLPVVNLNPLIIEGALIAIAGSVLLVLSQPRYLLFTVKAVALFALTRALFMSLTHVGIYPGSIDPGTGAADAIYAYLQMQTGFFFSGHTGLPFLMALIFWRERAWRYGFFALSGVFGAAVLLAHVHYSVDVFAAPFMAYGIFVAARYLFERDWRLIHPEYRRE